MPGDKYSAVWVSHSSISDFLKCPRAYYLKNVYRQPQNRKKVKIISPSLALGQAVHEVLESLSVLPVGSRFTEPLLVRFERAWEKVSGKKGGFFDLETEFKYKQRGQAMLRKVMENPGPIARLAVKIQQDLPYFWLSEEQGLILCGKIDWLEYFPEENAVHIIDFKTGKREEDKDSLQLSIYYLLTKFCQNRNVKKLSYWYLDQGSELSERPLPDLEEAKKQVTKIAMDIKLARQIERFKCPHGGCFACKEYEAILRGEAEKVGEDEYRSEVYIIKNPPREDRDGVVL